MTKIVLVLLFAFSLYAGENEEIGSILFSSLYDSKFGKIDSATLSNSAEKLYTLQGDLVTGYETNPMKKMFSFHTGIEEVQNGYRILVTQDDKRIILRSRDSIQLWDIKTKTLLKKVSLDTRGPVISSQYGLIVLTKDDYLEILDDQSLETIRKSAHTYVLNYDNGADFDCTDHNHVSNMFINKKILLLDFGVEVMFVDVESFKIMDQVSYRADMAPYFQKYSSFFTVKRLNKFFEDQTRLKIRENVYIVPSAENNTNDDLFLLNLVSGSLFISKFSYDSSERKQAYRFYPLNDEWLLTRKKSSFTGSEDIKNYLQMMTKDKKIVPINEATFKKYNTPINLKAD